MSDKVVPNIPFTYTNGVSYVIRYRRINYSITEPQIAHVVGRHANGWYDIPADDKRLLANDPEITNEQAKSLLIVHNPVAAEDI